jgi:ribosomal protein L20
MPGIYVLTDEQQKKPVLWRKRHKAKMKEADITYAELVKRLKKHGLKETEAGITMKLKRGTFSATFFLACLAAMELEGVVLEEI